MVPDLMSGYENIWGDGTVLRTHKIKWNAVLGKPSGLAEGLNIPVAEKTAGAERQTSQ